MAADKLKVVKFDKKYLELVQGFRLPQAVPGATPSVVEDWREPALRLR